jgi:putative sporulation protein YyaC
MFPFRSRNEREKNEKRLHTIKSGDMVEETEIDIMVCEIEEIFRQSLSKDIVILCVGSDLSMGDSLGPLVGTMLKENQVPYHVYGTLKEPVHAQNLEEVLKKIHKQFSEPFIFGIDASLGDKSKIGYLFLEEGPLVPGKALKKVLPNVGDYHMKAIINYIDPVSPTKFLEETRLYTVMNLARLIVTIITRTAALKNK